MNIVIISDYTPAEVYIIEQVTRAYPGTVTVAPDRGENNLKPVSFLRRRRKIYHLINGFLWKMKRRSWKRRFYPGGRVYSPENVLALKWDEINREAGVQALRKLEPEILITCRAPILSSEVIGTASRAALNMHFGITPYYRGNDTLFWALFRNDPDHIGGTIHYLSPGVDTGEMLVQAFPALEPGDNETDLEVKIIVLMTRELIQLLKRIELSGKRPVGAKQPETGQNFRKADRTILKRVHLLMKRLTGMVKLPKREERVSIFYGPEHFSK